MLGAALDGRAVRPGAGRPVGTAAARAASAAPVAEAWRAAGRRTAPGDHRGRRHTGLLEPLDAGQQGGRRVVGLGVDQADQRHLEVDPGVGRVAHADLGPAEVLHGPHQGGQPDPAGLGGQRVPLGPGHGHQLGGDQGQEALAEVVDQVDGELLGAEPGGGQVGDGHQGPLHVALGQGLDHLVELGQVVVDGVRGRHLVEDRQGVAGRATAPPDGEVERVVPDVEMGVVADLGEESSDRVSGPSSRNSKCWVRLRMVGRTFCGSVVASTKTTWAGGSSSVFSSALDAAVESMWTSSTM